MCPVERRSYTDVHDCVEESADRKLRSVEVVNVQRVVIVMQRGTESSPMSWRCETAMSTSISIFLPKGFVESAAESSIRWVVGIMIDIECAIASSQMAC
jgi:hypothetical protein